MKQLILFLFTILIFQVFHAQDIDYARSVLTTLCSKKYHGRGYVKKGDKKAARYIRKQLKKNNIQPFNKNYFQEFTFAVNTFPSKISFTVDEHEFIPGVDYLVTSNSSSLKGDFELYYLNQKMLNEILVSNPTEKIDLSNRALLYNPEGMDKEFHEIVTSLALGAPLLIEMVKEKLVYRMSQKYSNFAHVQVLSEKIDTTAQSAAIKFKNRHFKNYPSQNVIGYIPGLSDSLIVYTAHYDHLGRMGKEACFPGANDNGSGVSMVLNLAQHYGNLEKKPKYTIAFIFFSAEEVGLIGSKYFTENPLFELDKIKYLMNLDLVGTGDEGIMMVNGKEFPDFYKKLVALNDEQGYLPEIKARPKAANSDHYYFSEKGVQSFFMYTLGGITEYHSIYDKAETLPLTEFEDIVRLLIDFQSSYE